MARYPGAKWVGCASSNYSTDRISPDRLVIHVTEGSNLSGTVAWFKNPAAQVSAHFGNPRWLFARMVQFVDTSEMAYHCAGFNPTSVGIENVGYSGQPLTLGQKIRLKRLIKWLNAEHSIPIVYTSNPSVRGIIGHGKLPEGALSHPFCPGEQILVDVNVIVHQLNRKAA